MTSPIQRSPAEGCGTHEPFNRELPGHLERWWKEKPALFESDQVRSSSSPTLPQNGTVDTDSSPVNTGRFHKCAAAIRAKWDRGSLAFVTKLPTPSILLGIILTSVGLVGLMVVAGIQIDMLSFISNHVPASIIISLTMIRAGLHTIAQGVRLSRRHQRYRLEIEQNYHLLRIQQHFEEVSDKAERIQEIKRVNQCLPPSKRKEHQLPAGYPYSKRVADLPTSSQASYQYRYDVQQAMQDFKTELPALEEPTAQRSSSTIPVEEVDPERTIENTPPSKFLEKWYDWWHNKMPTLGKIDFVVGQLMLFCAIGSIFVLFLAPAQVPSIFSILVDDPSISLAFSFILLANWVNCTRTGWRLLNWKQREARRNSVVADLQLIDLELERKNVEDFHQQVIRWLGQMEGKTESGKIQAARKAIKQSKKQYEGSLPDLNKIRKEADTLRNESQKNPEHWVQTAGKHITPYLPSPSIVMGCLITLVGVACLAMTLTNHIPPYLHLLTKNAPLSVLFSTGLLVAGIHALHRGISMSDRSKKDQWNIDSFWLRAQFIKDLKNPRIESPGNRSPLLPTSEVDTETAPRNGGEEERRQIAECCHKLSDRWFEVWGKSLKHLWVPDMVLGGFVLFSSLAGLAIALGAPAPVSLQFISADPSFSVFFCLGLTSVGIDALNTSWRIASYQNRKKQDEKNRDLLQECYTRLKSRSPTPLSPPPAPHPSLMDNPKFKLY